MSLTAENWRDALVAFSFFKFILMTSILIELTVSSTFSENSMLNCSIVKRIAYDVQQRSLRVALGSGGAIPTTA